MLKFVNTDILKIIQSPNPIKAHGHDKMSIRMLKICKNSKCWPLEVIFNNSVAYGIFPSYWKKVNTAKGSLKKITIFLKFKFLKKLWYGVIFFLSQREQKC